MQYKIDKLDKGKVEIKVDIPKAAFEEAYVGTVSTFKKNASIAGFRPGMAPDDLVVGHVGANKVLNETASFLISKHLSDILKKEDLIPLDSPKIAIESLSAGSPFSFVASFTKRPKVTVGDWKKVKVKKVTAKEVTEADVEASIKNIFDAWEKQKSQSQSEESKSRNEGEEQSEKFIYDAKGNKVHFSSDKQTLQFSSRQGGIAGLKIPIKTEGKNKVNVHTIDDEFAKAIGARDVAHLREIVKKDLETLIADQVESQLEQEIFDEILKLGEVEVPDILVDDELNRILIRLNNELEKQGKTLEAFLEEEKTTLDGLKDKWREQATKNVKISLIMDTIGRAEKIQVTKEELEATLSGVNQANLSADQKRDLENYLVRSIFQAKTLDLVKKTVTA